MILKKKLIFESTIMKKKKYFEKHDSEGKIIIKKQILKKTLHTKNHVLIHFTP